MVKGRKPNNKLPDCKCIYLPTPVIDTKLIHEYCPVVELSEDGKKVRCKICGSIRSSQAENSWIKKESLAYHLRSELHSRSIIAQREQQQLQFAREQSIREENAMEEHINFITLASTSFTNKSMSKPTRTNGMNDEAKNLCNSYQFLDECFDAGADPSAAEIEERKRLEREANDFDIWHAADFLPNEELNNGEMLLEELEQDDILAELLRNSSE